MVESNGKLQLKKDRTTNKGMRNEDLSHPTKAENPEQLRVWLREREIWNCSLTEKTFHKGHTYKAYYRNRNCGSFVCFLLFYRHLFFM